MNEFKSDVIYARRTFEHINRVKINAVKLIENMPDCFAKDNNINPREVFEFITTHDDSKFNDMQYFAYRDFDFGGSNSEHAINEFNKAWINHQNNEKHHYEGLRYMTRLNMIDVACDLQAMADEFNEGSAIKYFKEEWIPEYLKYFKQLKVSQGYAGNYCDDYEYFSMVLFIENCIDIINGDYVEMTKAMQNLIDEEYRIELEEFE